MHDEDEATYGELTLAHALDVLQELNAITPHWKWTWDGEEGCTTADFYGPVIWTAMDSHIWKLDGSGADYTSPREALKGYLHSQRAAERVAKILRTADVLRELTA